MAWWIRKRRSNLGLALLAAGYLVVWFNGCQPNVLVDGLQPPNRLCTHKQWHHLNTNDRQRRTLLWSESGSKENKLPLIEETNGERKEQTKNMAKDMARAKRTRSVDYPSFSYNVNDRTRRRRGGKKDDDKGRNMKYKGCGCENVKFQKPPVVSIPADENTDSPLRDAISMGISGGFESEISVSALRTRLLKNRSYAKKDSFSIDNINVPPSLSDLSYPPSPRYKGFWVGFPARILTAVVAYYAFPYLTSFLESFVNMQAEDLDEITSKFGPGVSVLYGTFISLTLSILYNRVKEIQEAAARESAMLTLVTRNFLSIFKDDQDLAIEAAQCCADQIRTMVQSSRGAELMLVMYSDPYARMAELLNRREEKLFQELGGFGSQGNLLGNSRDCVKDLIRMRAERLSMESQSLPPTHFQVLNLLTFLILLSYVVSILPTVDRITGAPPGESSIIFAVLTNIYIMFYFFAKDLNNPFEGVYQIRRSSSACNFLEAKWLIANHPLVQGQVDFEEIEEGEEGEISICSPGLGVMTFERDDIVVDSMPESENDVQ